MWLAVAKIGVRNPTNIHVVNSIRNTCRSWADLGDGHCILDVNGLHFMIIPTSWRWPLYFR
jgi:hypothetical protein